MIGENETVLRNHGTRASPIEPYGRPADAIKPFLVRPKAIELLHLRRRKVIEGPHALLGHDRGRNRDNDRDRDWDRDWDRGRDRRPDIHNAQRNCSRVGIQEAWNRNYYSAQYDGGPRLEYGRYGWELRGRMRLHNNRGYSYINTVCDLRRNGEVSDFDFIR